MASSDTGPDTPRKRFLLLQGILPLDRAHLTKEIIAGITLAAIGIPEVMGYTKIIGTPVVTGLYTMLLPMLAFAVFGSSRHLVVSADSATAAMVAASLVSLSFVPYSPKYVALTSLVGIVAAAMLLTARVLRLGFLADFLSRTVLVGFLSGVGIQIAFGEVHRMLGLGNAPNGFLKHFVFTLQHLPETEASSLLISVGVLAVILVSDLLAPRVPGALLAVIGVILASVYFNWEQLGIKLVGTVPGGLPQLLLPQVTWEDVRLVLPVAASCCVVILAQSAATSRAYAFRYRDRFDQNIDIVGLSLANLAAGLSSTFVVNGSPTKTAIIDNAGGRSQAAHLMAVAMVLLVLLFLTGPLSYLPSAALATIVFMIGVKLVDYRGLKEIYRKKPYEFALAVATAATVVLLGVEQGILLSLVLSLLQHVRRSYQPATAVVMTDPAEHWRLEPAVPGRMVVPGLVLYWFGAELFYANASHFTAQVRHLVNASPAPVHWMVVDAGAITAIDFSAGSAVKDLQQDLAKENVVLAWARVSPSLKQDLEALGLTKHIGANHIFASRRDCLAAYQAQTGN
jgi:SulP family sulfate permease